MEWVQYETVEERTFDEHSTDPFTWDNRGKKYRLAWELGSVEVAGFSNVAVWDAAYAVIVTSDALIVACARGDRVARLTFGKRFKPGWYDIQIRGRELRLKSTARAYSMALAELELLLEGKSRDESVTVRTEYPDRDPNARVECVYLWELQNGRTMLEIGDGKGGNDRPKLTVDLKVQLRKHAPLTVCDELRPGLYARAEIAGHPSQVLAVPKPPQTFTAALKISRAGHPEGEDRPVVAKADAGARARIDSLLGAIASDPDNDGHRAVLIDLLAELEDPAAPTFAAMSNGASVSAAKKKAALGPLASYILDYEVRAGLPITATLSRSATAWSQVLDEAVADYRLGLLVALRIGLGNHAINTLLITSPRALALRDVDLTHSKTIDAVIAAKRAQFTRVGGLDLLKPRLIAKLANPIFDRVTTFHAVVDDTYAELLIDALVEDPKRVFSRVARTLELEVKRGANALRKTMQRRRAELPLAAIVINGASVD